jgi:hypothetical protein
LRASRTMLRHWFVHLFFPVTKLSCLMAETSGSQLSSKERYGMRRPSSNVLPSLVALADLTLAQRRRETAIELIPELTRLPTLRRNRLARRGERGLCASAKRTWPLGDGESLVQDARIRCSEGASSMARLCPYGTRLRPLHEVVARRRSPG